jgi:cytochrome c553
MGRPTSKSRTKPVEVRYCPRHEATEFGLYGQADPRWKCKRCVAAYVTRRHQKVRRILVVEARGCCAVCGYDRCGYNLQFHHVDPASKSIEMSMRSGKSLASYREEAKKCVLVCANCHGEIETGAIPSPPAGARFGEDWTAIESVVPADDPRENSDISDQLTLCISID